MWLYRELPEEMEPKWTMTKRMKTRERARYQEQDRESSSSPSESIHSISRSVSNSQTLSTNTKSLLHKNNNNQHLNPPLFDDDISETSHSISTLNHQQISKDKSIGSNLVSPEMTEYSKFNFKVELL